mgnify:FL=1
MATLNIKVITTYNNKLYKEYAHRFKETYNWSFPLKIYNEDECMMKVLPDLNEFVNRNKHKQPYSDYKVKGKEFLTDGVRFSYKVYAYTHAIMTEDVDGLICIDADSVFHKKIDEEWIKKHIHRDDCMMTYLGRGNHYSECGFLYFNLNHADTLAYANRMKSLYDTDGIYNLKEQHDSYIWDYVRKEFENRGTRNFNIGDGKNGHVQARSILGPVYDHTKGNRKLKGRSPEARV